MKREAWVGARMREQLDGRAGILWICLVLTVVGCAPQVAVAQSAVWQPQGATAGSIYYTGGSVGVGTSTPSGVLDVSGSSGVTALKVWSTSPGTQAQLYLNGPIAQIVADGGGDFYITNALVNRDLVFRAGGSVEYMRVKAGGNVGIGTTNPQHLLHVAGIIGAQEVIVSSTGADYVFDPGYSLKPLTEVATYIEQNHHLPDIPSAEDAQAKGVSVGDMQTKLLAKIEELTLHMIRADQRNNRLEQQNEELHGRIARLEAGTGR
jgi:hypothetical protein